MTPGNLVSIAQGYLHVFDQSAECEHLLTANGFTAFMTYRANIEQFAESDADIALHRALYRDGCKTRASRANALWAYSPELRERLYSSPLVHEIQLGLAQLAGFDDVQTWQAAVPRWQTGPDPLFRARYGRLIPQGNKNFQLYETKFDQQRRDAIQREAARYAPGQALAHLPERSLDAFKSASQTYLSDLGFAPASTRLKGYTAFDHRVSKDVVLRWSLGEEHPSFLVNDPALLCRSLHFRHRSMKVKLRNAKQDSLYLPIPYASLVEGADVYRQCSNTQEIWTLVHAHSLLVRWIMPHVLKSYRDVIHQP